MMIENTSSSASRSAHERQAVVQSVAGRPRSRPMNARNSLDAHVPVERRVLGHVADPAARSPSLPHQVEATGLRRPGARAQVARQYAQDGCLSRTVGTKQAHDLALADLERDAVDRECAP